MSPSTRSSPNGLHPPVDNPEAQLRRPSGGEYFSDGDDDLEDVLAGKKQEEDNDNSCSNTSSDSDSDEDSQGSIEDKDEGNGQPDGLTTDVEMNTVETRQDGIDDDKRNKKRSAEQAAVGPPESGPSKASKVNEPDNDGGNHTESTAAEDKDKKPAPTPVVKEEVEPVPVLKKVTSVGNDFYNSFGDFSETAITLAPYKPKHQGAGIRFPLDLDDHTVVKNKDGLICRFNEPFNRMGRLLLDLHMVEMLKVKKEGKKSKPAADDGEGPRVGEEKPFRIVFTKLSSEIQRALGYQDEAQHDRRTDVMWTIQKGFNSTGDFNRELRKIAEAYAQRRLGAIPTKGTELRTAVICFQEYFLSMKKDNKGGAGTGQGWMVGVHMLNDHLSMNGVTPIILYADGDTDSTTGADQRKTNSKEIYIMNPDNSMNNIERKIKITVEAREEVRAELSEFLARCGSQVGIPNEVTPPTGTTPEPKQSGAFRVLED